MSIPDVTGASDRQYRRGAILGLTMAESFLLLAFAMLLMLGAMHVVQSAKFTHLDPVFRLDRDRQAAVAAVASDPDLLAVMDAVRGLPPPARAQLARELPDSRDMVGRLLQSGEARWRFVSPEQAQRLVAGVTRLPSDQQAQLTDLIALTEPAELAQILQHADQDRDPLAEIETHLGAALAADTALIKALNAELGHMVEAMGGKITAEGALVFPETVLFEIGSSQVRPGMYSMLNQVCPAWLRILSTSEARIEGARIEGHASSDWGRETGRPAYLGNLTLSQARAASVLRTCLGFLPEGSALDRWAIDHLLAVGYSSSRPVLLDGAEDPTLSRRVVFRVDFDRTPLLQEVRAELFATGQTDLHHSAAQGMDGLAGP